MVYAEVEPLRVETGAGRRRVDLFTLGVLDLSLDVAGVEKYLPAQRGTGTHGHREGRCRARATSQHGGRDDLRRIFYAPK